MPSMAETGPADNSSECGQQQQQQQQQGQPGEAQGAHDTQPTHSQCGAGVKVIEAHLTCLPSGSPQPVCNGATEPDSPSPEDSLSSGGEHSEDVATPSWLGEGRGQSASNSMESSAMQFDTDHYEGIVPLSLEAGPFLPPPVLGMNGGERLTRSAPTSPPPLQGEELHAALLKQLEYYFSKDNLSSDKYLQSQMDGDHYVSVSTIANFNQVRRLTMDMNMLLSVIKESQVLQLDDEEEKVRAVPEKRCVLILREIPKDTPKERITSLFSSPNCPRYVTCEFAENDCWYISFVNEEDTQKAFAYLREEVREFLGQPIRARIKGMTVQRPSGAPKKSRYPPYTAQPTTTTTTTMFNGQPAQMPYYQQPGMVWPPYYEAGYPVPYVNGTYPPSQGYNGPTMNRYNAHQHMPSGDGVRGGEREGMRERGGGRGGGGFGGRGRVHRGHSPIPSEGVNGERGRGPRDYHPSTYRFRRDGEDRARNIPRLSRKHRGTDRDRVERDGERSQPPRQQHSRPQPKIDLAPAHFPPLPNADPSCAMPLPAPPSHSAEEGVSNLADIVRGTGKRPNNLVPAASSSANSNGHAPNPIKSPAPNPTTSELIPVQASPPPTASSLVSKPAPTSSAGVAKPATSTTPAVPPKQAPVPASSVSKVTPPCAPAGSLTVKSVAPAASVVVVRGHAPSTAAIVTAGHTHSSAKPSDVNFGPGSVSSGPQHPPPPKYQRAEIKHVPSRDSKAGITNKNSRNTQVSRTDGKPQSPGKSRHRDYRDYRDRDHSNSNGGSDSRLRDRRNGSTSRPVNRPSPSTPKKAPPPTPAHPSDHVPAKAPPRPPPEPPKPEKLSYAQMAQKPKSQPPPPPPLPPPKPSPATTNSSVTSSSAAPSASNSTPSGSNSAPSSSNSAPSGSNSSPSGSNSAPSGSASISIQCDTGTEPPSARKAPSTSPPPRTCEASAPSPPPSSPPHRPTSSSVGVASS